MEVVPRLDKDFSNLERSAASNDPPVWHLRDRSQAVSYLIFDASGKGFGSTLWRYDII